MAWMRFLVFAIFMMQASAVMADVRLPSIFSDNMVIQQGTSAPVWGWAAPAERVTVSARKTSITGSAKIDGETIVVSSTQVSQPVAVRYGWVNNPDCNLYNAAGLPASPFRTDDWPGVTINER
jgi:hypothetical protein